MTQPKPQSNRPRIAAVITEYRRYSHAQHILDRFLYGYGWGTRHHRPAMDLVSLYVDQQPENDLSREREEQTRAARYGCHNVSDQFHLPLYFPRL